MSVLMVPRRTPDEGGLSSSADEYALEVGRRIVQARKERGLTQVQLAAKIGVSQRSMQAYENGETIPYNQLKKLSKALGRDQEWILHGEVEGDRLGRLENKVDELTRLLRSVNRKIQ